MVIHPVTVYRFDIKLNYNCTGALLNQLTEMFVIGCSLPNKLIQKFYYVYDGHYQDCRFNTLCTSLEKMCMSFDKYLYDQMLKCFLSSYILQFLSKRQNQFISVI